MCKLFYFHEERPQKFSDETDVDSYFYHEMIEISRSRHRIVRVGKGSYKKSVASKLFQICYIKTQQRYILREEVTIFKRKLSFVVDSLRVFLKTFDKPSKCLHIPLAKPKIEIGYTKSNDNLFAHYYSDIIEHPNRQIR